MEPPATPGRSEARCELPHSPLLLRRQPGPKKLLPGNSDEPQFDPRDPGDGAPGAQAKGLRALLVEDQTIIALDTESILFELGAASVVSFTTAEAALQWLAVAQADLGVLDIALAGATSYPVADALMERAIPFMFTTGYGDTQLIPERFAGVPVVHKPYSTEALATAVAVCINRRTAT